MRNRVLKHLGKTENNNRNIYEQLQKCKNNPLCRAPTFFSITDGGGVYVLIAWCFPCLFLWCVFLCGSQRLCGYPGSVAIHWPGWLSAMRVFMYFLIWAVLYCCYLCVFSFHCLFVVHWLLLFVLYVVLIYWFLVLLRFYYSAFIIVKYNNDRNIIGQI